MTYKKLRIPKQKQKIHIAYLLTQLELGGAQKHLLSLIEHLNVQRFQAILITSSEEGPLTRHAKELLRERLVEIPSLKREIQPFMDLKTSFQILSILKEYPVDIVHTHSSKAGIIGRWAAWRAGVPHIVHTIHGFGFTPEQPLWGRRLLVEVEQRAASITNRLVAVSKAVIEEGCQLNIGVRSQYEWIPCGIDPSEFEQIPAGKVFQLKEELGIPNASALVTMVACFKPQKAPLDFVRAAAIIAQRLPQARFLMVGDGVLREQIERERQRLKMNERLILAGWRWDIPVILAASDVVVLTSRWEGLPSALLEAMASGKPIVATDVGGVSEVVKNGENGFLVGPCDIEGIAAAVIQLIQNPSRAINMGRRGRERLSRDYEVTETVHHLENLYESMVGTAKDSSLCQTSLS